jgi:DNA polymerase-3 subunit gamma/tau
VSEPCNQCELCLAVNDGSAMDVIEMDAATNRGIEEVRDLRDRVKYAPALARYKVYIIDEVHMLTTEAFNALLKTLEEPPAHVIFIMATTEPQKLPATIVSRCQRFDFRPLTEAMIAEHLQQVAQQAGASLDPESARLLAFRAQGGMRDALGLLEQVISYTNGEIQPDDVWQALGAIDKTSLIDLANALHSRDIGLTLRLFDQFGAMGIDYRQLLSDLLELLRQSLLEALNARPRAKTALRIQDASAIMYLMDAVAVSLQDSRRWAHPRMAAELMAIKLCLQQPAPVVQAKGEESSPKSEEAELPPERWQEVLAQVKRESITSHAWLKEANALLEGGNLVLEYPENYRLHCDNVVKPEHRQVIVPAIKQVLGLDQFKVRIKE